MAGFGSEYVASFESEWVAGFVGIRTRAIKRYGRQSLPTIRRSDRQPADLWREHFLAVGAKPLEGSALR